MSRKEGFEVPTLWSMQGKVAESEKCRGQRQSDLWVREDETSNSEMHFFLRGKKKEALNAESWKQNLKTVNENKREL